MLRLALLGDSIAFGQGAARPEDRLGPRLQRGLASAGVHADVRVLAVPGARSADLRPQVDAALRWSPAVAVVVVGANDLGHRVDPAAAAADLQRAVTRLRDSGADVVVAPAPDLSVLPDVPAAMRALVREAGARLRAAQVQVVERAGGRVADDRSGTTATFAGDPSMFSADRFHPSSAGYAVIASVLLPTVVEAARAADGAATPDGAPDGAADDAATDAADDRFSSGQPGNRGP